MASTLTTWYAFEITAEVAVATREQAVDVANAVAAVPGVRSATLVTTRKFEEDTDGEG